MENKGVIVKGGNYIEMDNGVTYPISKNQKNHSFIDGDCVNFIIDTEYPETCDASPFCEGDETCIVCLLNNKVAIIVYYGK